jgi:hypothetical protein
MNDIEPEPPAGVLAGAIIFAMVMVLAALVWLCSAAFAAKEKDPKIRKPSGEIVLQFNESGAFEVWANCHDCGLTHYIHVQLRGSIDQQVAVITLWYDHSRTEHLRRKLFRGSCNPFDPLGGWADVGEPWALEDDPFK